MTSQQTAEHTSDQRPKTVVLHQQTGIGDLIWHIPYIRAVAKTSRNDQVALVAAPTTLARQIMAPETCVSEYIDYYHLPRTLDKNNSRKNRLGRMKNIVNTLKGHEFDRIVLFSGRASRGLIACWAGIPQRLGYGYRWTQRIFLNQPPYIERFAGKSNPVYHDATAFCIAHGFCDAPIIPKMTIPQELEAKMARRLAHLPRPLYTLAIGSSEDFKQWGVENYTRLAQALVARGFGVLLLGGKMDHEMATAIQQQIPAAHQHQVEIVTDTPILESSAAVKCTDACIGNDTGLCQIAAACDCLCYIIMGPRPTLDHDPIQHYVVSDRLFNITVDQVMGQLAQTPAPGF
ncbi:ADP-heptose--LPS heptosyltransferase 2 [Saezia sanguinis]|uniref:ADP-heptose--LPS heptosyltransferase 2 n=1 Tax=Saezia sanguinis TaxID=1965230 RepID=A0A433SA16_9BURK|nr:glycosyltransferase family 9 protein [Saezia sanguinis]RUS65571.1 ADP-heptose--LPS heptosyltransferase 2 [Saezia sanguinis]